MGNSLIQMVGTGTSPAQAATISGSIQSGQTALGTTQGTAFAIFNNYTHFSTTAAGTGAVLPPVSATVGLATQLGDEFDVYNNGANALLVYPPLGGAIGTIAVNTALSVPSGKGAKFALLTITGTVALYGAILSA